MKDISKLQKTLKFITITLIILFFINSILYILGVFYNLKISPIEWSGNQRATIAIINMCVLLFSWFLYKIEE